MAIWLFDATSYWETGSEVIWTCHLYNSSSFSATPTFVRWFWTPHECAAAIPLHRLAVLLHFSVSLTASSCSTSVLCIRRSRGLLHRRSISWVIDLLAYFHPLLIARQRVPFHGSPSTQLQLQVPLSGHSHLPSIKSLHSWRCAAYFKESQEGEHADATWHDPGWDLLAFG